MSRDERARPFVKWAGGKQALADLLVERFPRDFERYFEPCVGGGSVFFALGPRRAVLGDHNGWLMDAWRALRSDWKSVAALLDTMANTRDEYLRTRDIPHDSLDGARRAAHFIYLNKTCFRGLFRVNAQGRFNVPYGNYSRKYYDPHNLESVSVALRRVVLREGDFETCLAGVTARDFVYLDPPYYKLGGYSDFNRYTSSRFRESDHARLASFCRELDRRRVRWAVSNSDTALVRTLFNGFRIAEIPARREINLQSHKRDVSELLITNY